MTIEKNFDIAFVASLALKEKQIQQNYRPIIAVHKWFARRPGSLYRGLVLSEFNDTPLRKAFYESHDFEGRLIADPFMGGGIPMIEANRVGCDVMGFDINPMSAWIVREEMEHLDLDAYAAAARTLREDLEREIGDYYRTRCPHFGDEDVPVKYFLWVKTLNCTQCGDRFDLQPGYLIAGNRRHPRHVLVCADCGELNETNDVENPGRCRSCSTALVKLGPAKRNKCRCPSCGHLNSYGRNAPCPPGQRLFAIEYYNPQRRHEYKGRFYKKPDTDDLAKAEAAKMNWEQMEPVYVPSEEILPGDETDRLLRWGYRYYKEMFNPRQLLGLEISCRLISSVKDQRILHALATNLSDLLRYQNKLCRYDTMALKSLDIFSIHGFPVGLIECESNLLGIRNGHGKNVGSGGWANIIDKYYKAKLYCSEPFEIRREGIRTKRVPIQGEWIGERSNGKRPRSISIRCVDAKAADLRPASLDAVFTDPPYFGNVQYGELMDFCYVWLRRLVGEEQEGFGLNSTRSSGELTGNKTQSRGLDNFTEGLSAVYQNMARALKSGAPLVFTFHHNKIETYYSIGVAILDAGLTCSATIPCPTEMGGSIHIAGTGSSIIDSVFVCRSTGAIDRKSMFQTPDELALILVGELAALKIAGMRPSNGDIRCMVFGHMTRMAIWNLRNGWNTKRSVHVKLKMFESAFAELGEPLKVIANIGEIENANDPRYNAVEGHNEQESRVDAPPI